MIGAVLQRSLHVFCIREYESEIISDLENDLHQLSLSIVEIEHLAEEQRPHLRYCCAQRCSFLCINIKNRDRESAIAESVSYFKTIQSFLHTLAVSAGYSYAGHIPFYIGHEHRYSYLRKALSKDLKSDRFTGTCRAADEAMPVGLIRSHAYLIAERFAVALSGEINQSVVYHFCLLLMRFFSPATSIDEPFYRRSTASVDQWFHPYGNAVNIDEPFYRRSPASGDQWFHPYGNAVNIDEPFYRRSSASGDQWFHPYGNAVTINEPFYRRSSASVDQWFHPCGNAVTINETIIAWHAL